MSLGKVPAGKPAHKPAFCKFKENAIPLDNQLAKLFSKSVPQGRMLALIGLQYPEKTNFSTSKSEWAKAMGIPGAGNRQFP
jgi:hypothetical protein